MGDRRKNYRPWDAQQGGQDPVSPRQALPEDDLMTLRSLTHKKEALAVAAVQGPINLNAHQGQVGQTFVFTVTGVVAGTVWGTDFYTLDSALAAAAVHAGVLQPGKTGRVTVKIHPARVGFNGTMKNGVQSQPYAQFPGAYEIVKK